MLKIGTGLFYHYWDLCRAYATADDDGNANLRGPCPRRNIGIGIVFFLIVHQGLQIGILLLIAKGWSITRPALRPLEKRNLWTVSVSYALVQALGYGAATLNNRLVILIYTLVILVLYIGILRFIFLSIDLNVRALKAQMYLIRQANIDPTTTPAMDKYMLFRAYQRCMGLYVFMSVFLTILRNFVNLPVWIYYMLLECLDLFLFSGICYTFRFRSWSPYFGEVPAAPAPVSSSTSRGARQPQPDQADLQPWRFGHPLPLPPDHLLQAPPAPTVVVVVQNPATLGKDGTVLSNVAVGLRIVPSVLGEDGEVIPSLPPLERSTNRAEYVMAVRPEGVVDGISSSDDSTGEEFLPPQAPINTAVIAVPQVARSSEDNNNNNNNPASRSSSARVPVPPPPS